jgi:hypothetical protein
LLVFGVLSSEDVRCVWLSLLQTHGIGGRHVLTVRANQQVLELKELGIGNLHRKLEMKMMGSLVAHVF